MRSLLFLPLLIAAQGCGSSPAEPHERSDAAAFAVTDQSEYVVPASGEGVATIRFAYSNRSPRTAWIVNCRGPLPELQKLVDGDWVYAGLGGGADCLNAFPIEPGAQLRDEIQLESTHLAVGQVDGIYRLVWPEIVWNFERRTSTSLFGDLLPLAWRVSNPFALSE